MTDFYNHLKIGVCVAFFLGIGALIAGVRPLQVGVFVVLIVIGSVVPDIDHQDSIPRRYLGRLLLTCGIVGVLWLGVIRLQLAGEIGGFVASLVGVGYEFASSIGGVLLLLGGIGVAKLAGWGVDEFTTHRRWTHSLFFGAAFGLGIAGIMWKVGYGQMMLVPVVAGSVIGVGAHVYIGDR